VPPTPPVHRGLLVIFPSHFIKFKVIGPEYYGDGRSDISRVCAVNRIKTTTTLVTLTASLTTLCLNTLLLAINYRFSPNFTNITLGRQKTILAVLCFFHYEKILVHVNT